MAISLSPPDTSYTGNRRGASGGLELHAKAHLPSQASFPPGGRVRGAAIDGWCQAWGGLLGQSASDERVNRRSQGAYTAGDQGDHAEVPPDSKSSVKRATGAR